MKIKSFLRSTGVKLAGLALMVGALTSCGGKELSKVIPADIKVACRFDLKQTALNAGCSFNEKGQLELSPEINAVIGNDIETMAKVKMALMMTEGFDMSDMIFFMRTNNEPVFVASLSDEVKVVKNITAMLGEPESADGFSVFYPSGKGYEPVVAVKDARAWVASDLVTITDAIDAADKKHIGTMPGIRQFLDGDNAFAFVVSSRALNFFPSNFYNQWLCGSLKFDDKISSGELCMMDSDGKRYPFGETFGEVSTDFLRYVPADMNVVGALGPIESPSVKTMISMLATDLGSEGKYLTDIDGTIALALDFSDVAPGNFSDLFNVGKYDFKSLKGLLMVHYPQQTANDLVTTVSDLLSLQGQIVGDGPDNLKTFAFDSID